MQLTPLEYAIMRAVWDADRPMTLKDIGIELGYRIENATQSVRPATNKLTALDILTRTARNERRIYFTPKGAALPQVTIADARTGPKRRTGNINDYVKRKLDA